MRVEIFVNKVEKTKVGLTPPFLLKSLNIYVVMQTIEQQIIDAVQDNLKDIGFDLVKVTLKGSTHKVLEILIDRLDGKKVTIIDCRNSSRIISALLDVEDIISDKYFLEVSSAGIERPLIKFEDYTRFLGREASIKLKELLNGQTRYQGKIVKAEDNKIHLNNHGEDIVFSFDMIKKASLVLTDEMFRNLMNKK
ncbi:MAG: ribosome maturation factor RimP [Rickettsia endosymbiont of Sergentomyia squamirostris]|uniref:Ribosome maturation factor RimP n=1 Tax=Candidatus Tisiphia endosymbiont of Sergentomyia squamirostris TaxID=3113639 RepID=A0AAT9G819_9RICK